MEQAFLTSLFGCFLSSVMRPLPQQNSRKPLCRVHTKSDGAARLPTKSMCRRVQVLGTRLHVDFVRSRAGLLTLAFGVNAALDKQRPAAVQAPELRKGLLKIALCWFFFQSILLSTWMPRQGCVHLSLESQLFIQAGRGGPGYCQTQLHRLHVGRGEATDIFFSTRGVINGGSSNDSVHNWPLAVASLSSLC